MWNALFTRARRARQDCAACGVGEMSDDCQMIVVFAELHHAGQSDLFACGERAVLGCVVFFAVRCACKAGWGDQPWGVFLLAFGKGALRKGYGSSGLLGKIGGKFHKITLFETDRFVFRTEKMQKRRFSVWLMLVSYGGWQY